MRIEVLCTGDELLTGLIADTNSPYFMGRLLDLGEKVQRAQIVGDVQEHIVRAIREAAERADAVLVSGGLGPTADDLTAESAAAAMGVPLVENAEALAALKGRLSARGLALSANNARQAKVPEGAEVVQNPVGSAPMFISRLHRCTLFFVPGVPREYRALVDGEVLPRLAVKIAEQSNRVFRASRLLKTVGLPEAQLDARVAPLAKNYPQVVFGFRTHEPENHLKLLAEASTHAEAVSTLAAVERECRLILEPYIFGADEDEFGAAIGRLLQLGQATVSTAESLTGGALSALLCAAPGASKWFLGGVIAYQEALKSRWLHVDDTTLLNRGAVSQEVAVQMAQGIADSSGSTYGLSTTGFAGPSGGSARDPVGTVYCALSGRGAAVWEKHVFGGERERVRIFAAYAALDLLRRTLKKESGS